MLDPNFWQDKAISKTIIKQMCKKLPQIVLKFSNTISLKEIYTDRIDTLDYQNLFKENLKGLDPEELRRLIENLDFLKSLMLN